MAENYPGGSNEAAFLRNAGQILLQQNDEEIVLQTLKEVATLLSKMEQLSLEEVEAGFAPLPTALHAEEILKLRETNVDINVALATCLCEILRLTAPSPLYNDDHLKDVFGVIVNSFEDLNDISSQYFHMRMQNLETMANLRLSLLMLDIDCKDEIDELFDIFLVAISDDHPPNVSFLMECIMIDTINNSTDEEISVYMIRSLMGSMELYDSEVNYESGVLAKRVVKKCKHKLRSHIIKFVEASRVSLEDYFDIVTSICEGLSSSDDEDDDMEDWEDDENHDYNGMEDEEDDENHDDNGIEDEQDDENHDYNGMEDEEDDENHDDNGIEDEEDDENHDDNGIEDEEDDENHDYNGMEDEKDDENHDYNGMEDEEDDENYDDNDIVDEEDDEDHDNDN